MTHRERELLRFIERYMAENDGVAPTFVEMSAALGGRSKSGIHAMVKSLERQGKLRRTQGHHRAIELVDQPVNLTAVPDSELLREVASRGLIRAGAAA